MAMDPLESNARVNRVYAGGCGGHVVELSCGHTQEYEASPPRMGQDISCPVCREHRRREGAKNAEELVAEMASAQMSAAAAVRRLQRVVDRAQPEIRFHELRLQANQKIMRLMLAMSALVDIAGEQRNVFWEHGLVSREQYDALAWEFQQIGIPAGVDKLKWTDRSQSKKALLEILEDYRKEQGGR